MEVYLGRGHDGETSLLTVGAFGEICLPGAEVHGEGVPINMEGVEDALLAQQNWKQAGLGQKVGSYLLAGEVTHL